MTGRQSGHRYEAVSRGNSVDQDIYTFVGHNSAYKDNLRVTLRLISVEARLIEAAIDDRAAEQRILERN